MNGIARKQVHGAVMMSVAVSHNAYVYTTFISHSPRSLDDSLGLHHRAIPSHECKEFRAAVRLNKEFLRRSVQLIVVHEDARTRKVFHVVFSYVSHIWEDLFLIIGLDKLPSSWITGTPTNNSCAQCLVTFSSVRPSTYRLLPTPP